MQQVALACEDVQAVGTGAGAPAHLDQDEAAVHGRSGAEQDGEGTGRTCHAGRRGEAATGFQLATRPRPGVLFLQLNKQLSLYFFLFF